jgi:hypothetical protein
MLGDAQHIQKSSVQHTPVTTTRTYQPTVIGGLSTAAPVRRAPQHANHVTAHTPQPTKTLMRRVVKKPVVAPASTKPTSNIRAHSNNIHASRMSSSLTSKQLKPTPDVMRTQRATQAPRSQSVQHFQSLDIRPIKTTAMTYGAQKPFASDIKLVHPHQTQATAQAQNNFQARRQQQLNRTTATQATRPALTRPTVNTAQQQSSSDAENDIFSQALASATSHEQKVPHESTVSKIKHGGKKKKRVLSIVTAAAVFMVLSGFVAVQNRQNIQLQIAGAKAGFSVAVPMYKPDGYNMDKMTYAAGSVATLYKNTGSQSFTLTQKKSNWDSQTLLENFVASSGDDYKGFQSNGRTIYVYGKGKATWVNGGIWYQIQGADELTNEQLVKIAASM